MQVERAAGVQLGSTSSPSPSARRWTAANPEQTRLREPTKDLPASLCLSSLRPGHESCRKDPELLELRPALMRYLADVTDANVDASTLRPLPPESDEIDIAAGKS